MELTVRATALASTCLVRDRIVTSIIFASFANSLPPWVLWSGHPRHTLLSDEAPQWLCASTEGCFADPRHAAMCFPLRWIDLLQPQASRRPSGCCSSSWPFASARNSRSWGNRSRPSRPSPPAIQSPHWPYPWDFSQGYPLRCPARSMETSALKIY